MDPATNDINDQITNQPAVDQPIPATDPAAIDSAADFAAAAEAAPLADNGPVAGSTIEPTQEASNPIVNEPGTYNDTANTQTQDQGFDSAPATPIAEPIISGLSAPAEAPVEPPVADPVPPIDTPSVPDPNAAPETQSTDLPPTQ